MIAKEYKIFTSPAKTAKENNLIIADGVWNKKKRLFDFSLLKEIKIPEEEKEAIKEYALKYVTAGFQESLYAKSFNNFHICEGRAIYSIENIYDANGKRLYDIFYLNSIKHSSAVRKSVYEDFVATEYQII